MEETKVEEEEKKSFIYQRSEHFLFFERMRLEGKLCDVLIEVDGECFAAHKFVLAATVPFFEKMFLHEFKESHDDKITLHKIRPRSMEAIISLAYTGSITFTEDSAENLMLDADFLGLKDVTDECAKFLESCISLQNVLKMRHFAEMLHCKNLYEKTQRFMLQHFQSFEKTDEFLNMSFNDLKDLVSSDDLQIISERHVFEAGLRWLKYNTEERKHYLLQLLSYVRLPYLPAEYIVNNVLKNEFIASSNECKELVNNVIYSRIISKEQCVYDDVEARCSDGRERILILSRANLSLMDIYNPIRETWEKFTSNKKGRMFLSSAVLKGKLYTVGGEFSILSSVEVYEPHNNSWKEMTTLRSKRSFPRVVALGDFLYVCGGHDGDNYLSIVERYCPETDEWETVAPMNCNRYCFGAIAFQRCIYVCGGYNENSYLTSIERYDPQSDKWTIIDTSMKQDRYHFGITVLNDKVYLCGGRSSKSAALNSVEVYDPISNTCEYAASMYTPRRSLMVVAYRNKLWAIGGYDGMDDLSSVEIYDPETDSWSYGASLSGTRPWVCGGIIPIY